ncbi:MotA/TolQ/ExbB proton channel family protein [Capnocytophaga sp. ARDL2]|uniref:MotA/TolQ/ExbB proton channel family protein n=1 Tax=Capnocytophaga sp. ARDL2 TaxID=3238809 RepID=UPI003556CA93
MFTILQVPATDTLNQVTQVAENQTQEPIVKETSLYELIFSGGIIGQSIMVLLFVMLFAVLFIYIERWLTLKSTTKVDANFMPQIKTMLSQGKLSEARSFCKAANTPVARVIEKGISRIGKPIEHINMAMENAGKAEVYHLEKNTHYLATLSGIGPMTGFLGTVVGMVLAFREMAEAKSSRIDMSMLSEGVYTAMMTTVFGLIVGIIAYLGYNHIIGKIDRFSHKLEAEGADFFDLLNEPA